MRAIGGEVIEEKLRVEKALSRHLDEFRVELERKSYQADMQNMKQAVVSPSKLEGALQTANKGFGGKEQANSRPPLHSMTSLPVRPLRFDMGSWSPTLPCRNRQCSAAFQTRTSSCRQ